MYMKVVTLRYQESAEMFANAALRESTAINPLKAHGGKYVG
jgi:hypothetical protein